MPNIESVPFKNNKSVLILVGVIIILNGKKIMIEILVIFIIYYIYVYLCY